MTRYILETPVGYRSFWLPTAQLPVIRVHVLKDPNYWQEQDTPAQLPFEVHEYYPTRECLPVERNGKLYCTTIYRMPQ